MLKRIKLSGSTIIALLLALLLVPLAHAVFVNINTNDDTLDPDWGTTTPSPYLSDASGDGTGGDDLDITDTYVGTSGNGSGEYLYFRVDTVTGPSAPGGGASLERLNAAIDCNDDGDFIDNGATTDLAVIYIPETDEVEVRVTATSALVSTTGGGTFDGEQPSGNNNSNEWQVQKGDLASNGCTNAVNGALRFAFTVTVGATDVDDVGLDGSGPSWNSPTNVSLQGVQASNQSGLIPWSLALVAAVALLTVAVVIRLRRTATP